MLVHACLGAVVVLHHHVAEGEATVDVTAHLREKSASVGVQRGDRVWLGLKREKEKLGRDLEGENNG